MLLLWWVLHVVFSLVKADYTFPDYLDHACLRSCVKEGPSRTCEYNFTIEWYYTMTVHCGDCPFNKTHCSRPNCVPAEGTPRAILTVNRQLPGPAIQVCKGDLIIVNVFSHPDMSEGVTIHWHGLHQKGSQFNDGAEMITQCPITPFTRYQYRFSANNPGTHFWHSHAGLQRADGLFGPLIVREPVEPMAGFGFFDLPNHVIIINDWFVNPTINRYAAHSHGGEKLVKYKSLLINGHGVYRAFEDKEKGIKSYTPRAEFVVAAGNSYRFRVIHNGVSACPVVLSVANHSLLMIASDGADFEPVEVDAFMLSAGERYDFVLTTNQAVQNYWLKVEEISDCGEGERKKIPQQLALIRYENATDENPDYQPLINNTTRLLNTWNAEASERRIPVASLNTTIHGEDSVDGIPDKKFYLALDTRVLDDLRVTQPELHPVYAYERRGVFYAPQINKITLMNPPSPLLFQSNEIPEDMFCDSGSIRTNCSEIYCICVHRLKVELGDLVELVVVDEGTHLNINHPMHLHGHSFRVLAQKQLNTSTTVEEVRQLDESDLIDRRFNQSVLKDTIMVPDGGYVVLRFIADNPGFWLFHCHIQFHAQTSMGLVFQVGDTSQMPRKPKHFPTCGDWSFSGYDVEEKHSEGTHNKSGLIIAFVFTVLTYYCSH